MKTYNGSCHCGAVTYTADADLENTEVMECNCSHCSRKGFRLVFIPKTQFIQKSGEDNVTLYQFNKQHINHLFCKTCGVQSFATGTGPNNKEMVAINVRCIPEVDQSTLKIKQVNGKDF